MDIKFALSRKNNKPVGVSVLKPIDYVDMKNYSVQKERLEKERLEKERLEKERLEKERLEKERLEKERLEKERLEKERLEKERLEKERLEKERLLIKIKPLIPKNNSYYKSDPIAQLQMAARLAQMTVKKLPPKKVGFIEKNEDDLISS